MREGRSKAEWWLLPVVTVVVVLMLGACRRDLVFSDSMRIDGGAWSRYNRAVFEAEIRDTLVSNDMSIMLRTGSEYPYRNIYFFVTTVAPGGERIVDTVGYMLSDDRGNRLGSGFGDIRYHELTFRTNVYFPQSGTYRFRIEHAMRREELEGVYDVGVKVVRKAESRR